MIEKKNTGADDAGTPRSNQICELEELHIAATRDALKVRDAFRQRILIDPIRAIGFTFPADPQSTEPCRAWVFFVGEVEVSNHHLEAPRADLLRIVRRLRNLNARFGCEILFAPDLSAGEEA